MKIRGIKAFFILDEMSLVVLVVILDVVQQHTGVLVHGAPIFYTRQQFVKISNFDLDLVGSQTWGLQHACTSAFT